MQKTLKSYNGGTIFSITSDGKTIYYDNSGAIVSGNVLNSLSLDNFILGCASLSAECGVVDCPPNALNTNNGFCILSNSGVPLLSNSI